MREDPGHYSQYGWQLQDWDHVFPQTSEPAPEFICEHPIAPDARRLAGS
jgi:hypothetical protein